MRIYAPQDKTVPATDQNTGKKGNTARLDDQLNHARAKRMVFCVVGEHAVVAAAAAAAAAAAEEAAQTLRCTGDGGALGEASGILIRGTRAWRQRRERCRMLARA